MKPRPGQGSQLAGALESAGSGLRGETSVGSTGLDQARLDQEHELQRVEAALKRLDHGRFGLGRWNTEEEVDYVTEKVSSVVERLRELTPVGS